MGEQWHQQTFLPCTTFQVSDVIAVSTDGTIIHSLPWHHGRNWCTHVFQSTRERERGGGGGAWRSFVPRWIKKWSWCCSGKLSLTSEKNPLRAKVNAQHIQYFTFPQRKHDEISTLKYHLAAKSPTFPQKYPLPIPFTSRLCWHCPSSTFFLIISTYSHSFISPCMEPFPPQISPHCILL